MMFTVYAKLFIYWSTYIALKLKTTNKVLMLVLRDVEEDEHFEALDKAARANMEALWRDVDKPSR